MNCCAFIIHLVLAYVCCTKRSRNDVDETNQSTSLLLRSFYAGIEYNLANVPTFLEMIDARTNSIYPISEELRQLQGAALDPSDIKISGFTFLNLYDLWKCEVLDRNFEYASLLEKLINTSFAREPDIYQILYSFGHRTLSHSFLQTIRNPHFGDVVRTIDRLIQLRLSPKSFHIYFSMLSPSPCISLDIFLKLAKMETILEPETVSLIFERLEFTMTTARLNDAIQAMGQLNFILKAMTIVDPDKFTLYYAILQKRPVELIVALLEYVNQTSTFMVEACMMRQYDQSIVKSLVAKCPDTPSESLLQYALTRGYSEEFINTLSA